MNMMNSTSNNSSGGRKPGPARFFDTPAPGQFHSLAADTEDWESFVLVLEMRNEGMYPECLVAPGSMDVRKGGPDDLLIRHPDYEKCWFLDLSQVRTIRADALLPGFAALTEPELLRIRRELMFYWRKKESGMFLYGLPFIGETDSRRDYHANLKLLMEIADKDAAARYWRRLASSFRLEPKKDDDASVGSRDSGRDGAGRHANARFIDYLAKRIDRKSKSRSIRREARFLPPPSEPKMGLMYCISDMASFLDDKIKPYNGKFIELTFTPEAGELPGCESGFISVAVRFEEEKIMAEAFCKASPGAFDGIQLRRCSDRLVIGTIRNGRLEAELVPELEKGIYFARPGDIPLKGKWEER